MGEPHVVTLRATREGDLDDLYRFRSGSAAVRAAIFSAADPGDRATFHARWKRLIAEPEIDARTVRADGAIVGCVARWTDEGAPEVTCWVDPGHAREGIATRAMRLLLESLPARPVRARVADEDAAAIALLEKLGFRLVATGHVDDPSGDPAAVERRYSLD